MFPTGFSQIFYHIFSSQNGSRTIGVWSWEHGVPVTVNNHCRFIENSGWLTGLKNPFPINDSYNVWMICTFMIYFQPASARGIGIKVINKWSQIPKKRPVIVQKYLGRPLLINESKFDCRIYVYVTSYDPLRIYVYEDGLVRFCSTKWVVTFSC